MTRAEERALEAYPYNRAYTDNDIEYDGNFCNRLPYIEGYQQAEKDLALTWEDVHELALIEDRLIYEKCLNERELPHTKEFYTEVLKRFNEKKETNRIKL